MSNVGQRERAALLLPPRAEVTRSRRSGAGRVWTTSGRAEELRRVRPERQPGQAARAADRRRRSSLVEVAEADPNSEKVRSQRLRGAAQSSAQCATTSDSARAINAERPHPGRARMRRERDDAGRDRAPLGSLARPLVPTRARALCGELAGLIISLLPPSTSRSAPHLPLSPSSCHLQCIRTTSHDLDSFTTSAAQSS